ncbi:hypothetical protein [Mesorhizobium huakuii]|uniref:Uncharacterized protein n=1 Tax=Mesorhizobium huakuii TaxID=28104 RepID=A0ABZ0VNY6_9HYPH|nr:hypothetical protein [Mesorhizobium huakuii]WQB98637.1 hypothetical protein U0R22_002796 [Mesorhizobium huakuii]
MGAGRCGKIIPFKQVSVFTYLSSKFALPLALTRSLPSPISPHEAAARKGRRFVIGGGQALIANPSNKKRLPREGQNREQKT